MRTSKDVPKVAIFVPARNEENRVEAALTSIFAQDYPNFIVRCIDDQSTDRTWEIASRVAQDNESLQLLQGKSRPDGWLGKP